MDAQQSLSEGKLEEALDQLQGSVRSDPSNVKHRVFLFQLLAVMGKWDRALNQLDVIAELDDSALAMVMTYRQALHSEGLRAEVFSGKRLPTVFGEPEQWMALLFEALKLSAKGQYAQSQDLREQAFELAPATSGSISDPVGVSFNWIGDADSRMGPMLEAIVNGLYYWIPFHRIRTIHIEAPEDLRDMVWMPAHFTWTNGGEAVGLIPARYPGSEVSDDDQIRTAHKTIWQELDENVYYGLGQRMFATDVGEYSLMELREINLDTQEVEPEADLTTESTSS